jgi:hypothetical protein
MVIRDVELSGRIRDDLNFENEAASCT